MKLNEVGLKGWYTLKTTFKIIEVQVNENIRMAKCIDNNGNTFYLELDESILPNLTSSSIYRTIVHMDVQDVVKILHSADDICTVDYIYENDGKKNKGSVTGFVMEKDPIFGITTIDCVKTGNSYHIENKNILSLIFRDIKYYSNEQQEEDSL
jgi:hypothetical protein